MARPIEVLHENDAPTPLPDDAEPLYVVIEGPDGRGPSLKASLEFMDVPDVEVANVQNWQDALGARRLAAVFVGDDLDVVSLRKVVTAVGEVSPNTPIVRVRGGRTGKGPTR